jgi:hypothetical protein
MALTTEQKKLGYVIRWLAGTTEPFDDWDWDGKTLTIFSNGKTEKYKWEDICPQGLS